MAEHPPVEEPLLTVPEHAGITQIEFSPGGGFGFDGELFMAEFGDMAPMTGRLDVPHGRQVIRIDPASGEMQPFFHVREGAEGPQGMEHVATSGPKRPVDVRFSPDGDGLYVVVTLALYACAEEGPKGISAANPHHQCREQVIAFRTEGFDECIETRIAKRCTSAGHAAKSPGYITASASRPFDVRCS